MIHFCTEKAEKAASSRAIQNSFRANYKSSQNSMLLEAKTFRQIFTGKALASDYLFKSSIQIDLSVRARLPLCLKYSIKVTLLSKRKSMYTFSKCYIFNLENKNFSFLLHISIYNKITCFLVHVRSVE